MYFTLFILREGNKVEMSDLRSCEGVCHIDIHNRGIHVLQERYISRAQARYRCIVYVTICAPNLTHFFFLISSCHT
jgi:hypothetical protein